MNARVLQLALDPRDELLDPLPPVAEFVHALGAGAMVRVGSRQWAARRAASCLLQPQVGDRVALWSDGDVAWIIAVLERSVDGPAQLVVPRDTSVECAGRLSLRADEALALGSRSVTTTGDAVDVVANTATVTAGATTMVGGTLFSSHQRVDVHAHSAARTVDGVDRVHAQVIDQRAQVCASVKAEHVAIEGSTLVKLRGAQVHVG